MFAIFLYEQSAHRSKKQHRQCFTWYAAEMDPDVKKRDAGMLRIRISYDSDTLSWLIKYLAQGAIHVNRLLKLQTQQCK